MSLPQPRVGTGSFFRPHPYSYCGCGGTVFLSVSARFVSRLSSFTLRVSNPSATTRRLSESPAFRRALALDCTPNVVLKLPSAVNLKFCCAEPTWTRATYTPFAFTVAFMSTIPEPYIFSFSKRFPTMSKICTCTGVFAPCEKERIPLFTERYPTSILFAIACISSSRWIVNAPDASVLVLSPFWISEMSAPWMALPLLSFTVPVRVNAFAAITEIIRITLKGNPLHRTFFI